MFVWVDYEGSFYQYILIVGYYFKYSTSRMLNEIF